MKNPLQKNTYSIVKGQSITLMIPSIRTFWYNILWTSTEVDNKIMAEMEIYSMIEILKKITSDQISEINDKDIKDNIAKIEDYLIKTDDYTLIKCVYKHYDVLTKHIPQKPNLFAYLGMVNARDMINVQIINEQYEKVGCGTGIQYYIQSNTPEIIEEMLLKIAEKNPLKSV